MKHTPGPWSHDDGHVFTEENKREYNSIATVHDIYDNNGKPETNVYLIASAPELLEALIHAHKIIDRLCEDYSSVANKHANYTKGEDNVISKAINKAKGN